MLLIARLWWLAVILAIGLSSGTPLIFRGKIWQGIGSLTLFCGIAVAIEIVRATDISDVVIGAFFLIGIGVIILAKTLFFGEG